MVAFEKPKYSFPFSLPEEIAHLKAHKLTRGIPNKTADQLLLCTWNIANLGLHKRSEDHY